MEQKLKEFKSRRRREIILNSPKNLLNKIVEKIHFKKENPPDDNSELDSPLLPDKLTAENSRVYEEDEASILSATSSDEISFSLSSVSWLTAMTYFLYFLLWAITYLIAIQLEFGYVYLVLSGLIFIYFNTRTGPKREGEMSAYSVFNPGCEAIEGTLKAEQLEREFNLIKHEPVSPYK